MPDELDIRPLLGVVDPAARQVLRTLLNRLEELVAESRDQQEEIQRLRDEIRRLKGEHPDPLRRASKPPARDTSSEKERRKPRPRNRCRRPPIPIDRTTKLRVERCGLPADARFKGWVKTVVQDVVLVRRNTCFLREKFYSPSTGQTYVAELPAGYERGFGPGTKTLALGLCYATNVTFAPIAAFLRHSGLRISSGRVASLLTRGVGQFHEEKDEVLRAGLASSSAHGIDTTPTKVGGSTWQAHALCNSLYTVYHTTPTKQRLAALDALQGGRPRRYRFDALTLRWLEEAGVPRKHRLALGALPWEATLPAAEWEQLLATHLPGLPPEAGKSIREAAAVAAYHAQREVPIPSTLVADDAPQWRRITGLSLCWIHDGRHYKKLCPYLAHHRQLLEDFRGDYWDYYDRLLTYTQNPSPRKAAALFAEFDTLFSRTTGYRLLDERIARTREKKEDLLRSLEDPTIPLHNNAAELAARRRVRKRDASLAAKTPEGVRVWDTFQSLAETARKLDVSFLHYLHDRITRVGRIPRLAELIRQRSARSVPLRLAA